MKNHDIIQIKLKWIFETEIQLTSNSRPLKGSGTRFKKLEKKHEKEIP